MNAANDTDLGTRIRDLASARVLVVGDVMLDRFIIGSVNRISPEAPVPVLKVEHAYSMLGGAGNVIRNVAALGAIPSFVGVVGNDSEGEEVRALTAEVAGQARNHLLVETGRPTTRKTRYFANNQQLLRVDNEVAAPLTAETVGDLIRAVEQGLNSIDVLVLSDYAKGVLSAATVAKVVQVALRANCKVIVDPKTRDFGVYRGVDLITPNRSELTAATGLSAKGDGEIEQACKQVIATCDIEAVLATRSEEGMTLVTREGRMHHLAAKAREVFDVSGAGDTVAAVLSAALALGVDLVEAAHLANLAAGIVIGKVGTGCRAARRTDPCSASRTLDEAEGKIVGLETVLEQIGAWRRAVYGSALPMGASTSCTPGTCRY